MTLPRFDETKRNINLHNNNSANSIYQEGYNTTYKFDLPYKALVVNTNAISEKSEKNQAINESPYPQCGQEDSLIT